MVNSNSNKIWKVYAKYFGLFGKIVIFPFLVENKKVKLKLLSNKKQLFLKASTILYAIHTVSCLAILWYKKTNKKLDINNINTLSLNDIHETIGILYIFLLSATFLPQSVLISFKPELFPQVLNSIHDLELEISGR